MPSHASALQADACDRVSTQNRSGTGIVAVNPMTIAAPTAAFATPHPLQAEPSRRGFPHAPCRR
jgi:hypothetical protein